MSRLVRLLVPLLALGLAIPSLSSGAAPTPPVGFCDGSAAPAVGEGSSSQVAVHVDVFIPAYNTACPSAAGSISYLGTGDVQGKSALIERKLPTSFAASDVALSPAEKGQAEGDLIGQRARVTPVLQIPLFVNGVALAYNVPCAVPQVRFTSTVLSAIYSGLITKWNDATITGIPGNSALATCNRNIRLSKRADAAGITDVFKDYLAKRNPQWQVYKGPGMNQQWPTLQFACSGGGDAGMANCVRSFPGSIGYMSLATALDNSLSIALLENSSGTFVPPSPVNCRNAADSATVPPGVPSVSVPGYTSKRLPATMGDWSTVSITDAPDGGAGRPSYPVCSFSYAFIFYAAGNGYGFTLPGEMLRNDIDYLWVALYDSTQSRLSAAGYAPLPQKILDVSREGVRSITYVFDIP